MHQFEPFTPLPDNCAGWAARRPPLVARDNAHAALEAQAAKTCVWLATQHRDGIIPPAEQIVLDCLRTLQAIPTADRMYADKLMDAISYVFLETKCRHCRKRRANALLRIAAQQL